ncbi:MAG: antibiotic biosynthesis monooxygenase [Thermoprotei archaeon]
MIHVGLYYDVKPGQEKKFEEIFGAVKSSLGREEGFISGTLYRNVDRPNSYMILSEWSSLEHFKKFVASNSFRRVAESGKEILEREPRNRVFTESLSS